MRRNLSMVLILTMLITIIPGNFIVLADGSVNTQVTLFRETSGGSSAYAESQLYPNTNMGAEFRIKNDGSGNAFVRPIAALYFNEKLQKLETKDYNIQSGEEVLYKPVFFIPTDNFENYKIKYYIWNNNIQPLMNAITVNNVNSDYYGDTFENAVFVSEDNVVEGKIEASESSDFIKFIPQNTGTYTISAYGGSTISGYLYADNQSLISNNSNGDNYTISANVTSGQTYYLKTTGISECDYSILIQSNQEIAEFDIYEYDSEIKEYKDDIIALCEKAYDDNDTSLSQEIYNKYEQAYDMDLLLHEMPDTLKNLSKDTSNYDARIKTYYASKANEFEQLRQTYIDLYDEYEYSTGGGSPYPPGIIEPSSDFEPDSNFSIAERGMLDGTIVEEEENAIALMSNTQPSLTITSKTETSVTFNAVFPVSGASGNTFEFVDFNQGQTVDIWQYDIDKNGNQYNNWNEKSKSYTISNLVPGGMYYIALCWSTDGGQLSGGPNSIYRRIQLPPMTDQNLTSTSGTYVTSNIESGDKAIATSSNYKKWLSNMDSVYLSLKELTGFTPYNGRKIQIKSTREDMNDYNPDGVNYWMITWGWSGNPILISRPFYRSLMQRLSSGDWGDVMIHELSHDFDKYDWSFDNEVLADLKLSYVLQTKSASRIYRPDTNKYYTGSNIYDFFYTDQADSYQYSFANGWYHNRGMTAIMLRIKNSIGWDAFKKTFRYMSDLSRDEDDYIYSSSSREPEMGKFNIFMTKLRDYSGVDVISKLSTHEKGIIEDQYDGTISYYIAPPPVISSGSGGGGSTVNIQPGEYTIRRFIPESSGNYDIYTSPFGGTGVSNDTVIEVYSNETLTNSIGSNDDYGGTRFSKVTAYLSAYQTYYIKLRHYNNTSEIHADLKVTKSAAPVSLSLNTPVNVQIAAMEYSRLTFTPTETGQYLFTGSQYNGTTQTSNINSILELYVNEGLTSRVATSQYISGVFPQISVNLNAGVTYYLTYTGYLSRAARSRITVTKSLSTISDISNIDYNNGNNPMLGYSNILKFTLNRNVATSASYYIVPSLGWDNKNFYEKASSGKIVTFSNYSDEVVLSDVALTSGGGNILYTKIKVYNNSTENKMLLWESQAAASPRGNNALANLSFSKSGNSSYIYVNSPEYITKYDIVDNQVAYPDNNPFAGMIPKNKLFELKNVTGENTYYQTNTAWWGGYSTEYEPDDSFYVDVDFYNPTDNAVTVSIDNLAYGNEYSVMEYYYNGNGSYKSITIPSKEHRLLFEAFNAPLKLTHPGSQPSDWNWNRHRIPVILFDFQVSGGNVTVSSLAAYNRNKLYLNSGSENTLSTGETIGNGGIIYNADANGNTIWYGNIGDPRPNETDLFSKYKGIAKNQSAWIDSELNFIIDDAIPSGQHLRVNMSDSYYEDGVANPKLWWMTNVNPFNDKWIGLIYAMPGVGHNYSYPREGGGIWNFAFDYRDVRDADIYATGNNSLTTPVDASIVDDAKSDVALGWKAHFPNYPDDGNPDTDESRPVDEHSMSIGSWGATNHYTITVTNEGNNSRSINYQVKTVDNMTFGFKGSNDTVYTTQFISNIGNNDSDWQTLQTVNIPAHRTVTFEIVTTLGGGHGGANNQITIN